MLYRFKRQDDQNPNLQGDEGLNQALHSIQRLSMLAGLGN
jgi:hypothetical protein